MPAFQSQLPRLPQPAFWAIGAAIAFTGAIVARLIAEHVPDYRVPIWLAGAIVVFFGLVILSLGTKARLEIQDEDLVEGDRPQDGAGEGNRTLV